MLSPETSTLLTLCCYGASAAAGIAGMMLRNAAARRCGAWLAVAGFVCQTLLLALGFHKMLPGGLSYGAYLQMLAWFVVLCGIVYRIRFRQESPLLFAAPLSLLLFATSAPYLGSLVVIPASLKGSFYALHIGALFLSLGFITLGFGAGLIFLLLEGRIKSKQRMQGFLQDMPALSLLDRINAFTMLSSFPLYTLGIAAGLLWARPVFGATFSGDPKEVISFIVWAALAYVFHGRLSCGWRGRKPARMAVLIFCLCLFSIIVVNTFMETHHAFIRQ